MRATFSLFIYFFKESFLEIKNNLSIFGVYIFGLIAVNIVSNFIDQVYVSGNTDLRIVGKILFSLITMLILSKILYVMKIRISGLGEYKSVMASFLTYNVFYSMLMIFGLLIYLIPAFVLIYWYKTNIVFFWPAPLLVIFFYIMIFYSLTPFVAVFEDDSEVNFFKRSSSLTKRNLLLVIVNHFFAWFPYLFYVVINEIDHKPARYSLIAAFSLPEAVLQLIMAITTAKIYFYLLNLEESDV